MKFRGSVSLQHLIQRLVSSPNNQGNLHFVAGLLSFVVVLDTYVLPLYVHNIFSELRPNSNRCSGFQVPSSKGNAEPLKYHTRFNVESTKNVVCIIYRTIVIRIQCRVQNRRSLRTFKLF
jgi:hypothetical protein